MNVEEVQQEINAVKVALGSFARRSTDEQQRRDSLLRQIDEVPYLGVYISYTEEELKKEKKQLQDLLLAERRSLQDQDRPLGEYGQLISSKIHDISQRAPDEITQRYRNIGEVISKQQEIIDFRNLLAELQESAMKTDVRPGAFVVIEAPSGSGKTQLPFALRCLKTTAIHIVMTRLPVELGQNIYGHLLERSVLYLEAIKDDMASITKDMYFETIENWSRPLKTILLISVELGQNFVTISDLFAYVSRCESKQSLPVFFLDEVMSSQDRLSPEAAAQDRGNVRFLRNLLRSVGLVVVLMGTNSCAANLIYAAGASRGRDTLKHWCTVVTKLPKVSPSCFQAIKADELLRYLEGAPALQIFLAEQFQTSNPWFVGLIVQNFLAVLFDKKRRVSRPAMECLEAALSDASQAVYRAKRSLEDLRGLRGQFMMFLSTHRDIKEEVGSLEDETPGAMEPDSADVDQLAYAVEPEMEGDEEDVQTVASGGKAEAPIDIFTESSEYQVAYHFAKLCAQSNIKLAVSHDVKAGPLCLLEENVETGEGRGTPWIQSSNFPDLRSDALMFLLLGGGENRPAFRTATGEISTVGLYSELSSLSSQSVNNANIAALKRDGDLLEATGCVALCVASHTKGLQGVELSEFLLALANQLSLHGVKYTWDSSMVIRVRQIIPFLSPPNDPWPESFLGMVAEGNGNVANLYRPANNEMVDVIARLGKTTIFTAETKNHKDGINLGVFQGIVARAFQFSCKVHFALVHMLREGGYFGSGSRNRASWARFSGDHWMFEKTKLWRLVVDPQVARLSMSVIRNVPSPTKHIIFIEVSRFQ